jgi:hypothetical protein
MGFEITDYDGKTVYPGQVIQYKVRPLFGITVMDDCNYCCEGRIFYR